MITEFFRHNDKVYIVLRKIPHHNFQKKDGTVVMEAIQLWKEHTSADHVLKTPTHFVFCHTIQPVEFEEII